MVAVVAMISMGVNCNRGCRHLMVCGHVNCSEGGIITSTCGHRITCGLIAYTVGTIPKLVVVVPYQNWV